MGNILNRAPSSQESWFILMYGMIFKRHRKRVGYGVPVVVQWLTNPTRNHEIEGSIPGLAQWVKDLALLWLWCSSDLTPRLGTSTCRGCGPKKQKKKNKINNSGFFCLFF